MQSAVRRFMPGESMGAALTVAESMGTEGIGAVLTLLGENVTSRGEVEGVVEEYRTLLHESQNRSLSGEISVKLTQLGLDFDEGLAQKALLSLAAEATAAGSFVWSHPRVAAPPIFIDAGQ